MQSLSPNQIRRIINEERIIAEQVFIVEKTLQAEARRLQLEGYSPSEINEGIMDFLGKIRESLTNMLGQTDWAMGGKAQLADAICSMGGEMGSVLAGLPVVGGLFGGDKDGEKPPAAPEEEPEPA